MKRLLIIEDDKTIGNIYRQKFQLDGFEVALATDGETGLSAVQQTAPDVVVLDLMLPKLSGIEILKKMRAVEATRLVPVIVLTNAYLAGQVQEAWNAGANQCLVKACTTPRQVGEVVKKILAASGDSKAIIPGPEKASGHLASKPLSNPPPRATGTSPAIQSRPPIRFDHRADPASSEAGADSGLDLGRLLDFAENDAGKLHEMAELYYAQTESQIGQIRRELEQRRPSDARRLAMKGAVASGTLGLTRMENLLQGVSQCCTLEGLADAEKYLQQAADEMAGIRKFLADLTKALSKVNATPAPR